MRCEQVRVFSDREILYARAQRDTSVPYNGAMAFGRPKPHDEVRAAAYGEWLSSRDPFAIASFVLGLFSLIEFGAIFVFGIAGTILGTVALRRLNARMHQPNGRVLAVLGIGASVLSLLIAAHFVYRWI